MGNTDVCVRQKEPKKQRKAKEGQGSGNEEESCEIKSVNSQSLDEDEAMIDDVIVLSEGGDSDSLSESILKVKRKKEFEKKSKKAVASRKRKCSVASLSSVPAGNPLE